MKLKFPEGFLWGAATSANQIEGNNTNSDWWKWENSPKRALQLRRKGKNPDDYKSGIACDSYNRYEEDFDIAKQLNHNAHRFTIEWARIQPSQAEFDQKEIEHYRQVLQALRSRGIKTFVTLHHFSSPLWFYKIGGWEKSANVDLFVKYVERLFEELHELIDYVCVINEPNLYAIQGYFTLRWPPQKFAPWKIPEILRNFGLAQKKVYQLAKSKGYKFPVGTADSVSKVEAAWMLFWLPPIVRRYLYLWLIELQAPYADFIGIQYYSRKLIDIKPRLPKTDMRWEIYPKGLHDVLLEMKKFNKPVIITENGIADAKDTKREKFIVDHLKWAHKAIEQGVDLRGYFYWSLIDNMELADGFEKRFGLVEIDYRHNLERKVRRSAHKYAEICKTNELDT